MAEMDEAPQGEVVSLERAMQLALGHHQAGRLAEAEQIYLKVLQAEPDHSGALHYAGVIAHQSGRQDDAIKMIERALQLEPQQPIYLNSKALALRALRRFQEAQACYEQALLLAPDFAEVHNNLGNVLLENAEPEKAAASYRRAIALKPDYVEAYGNLGSILITLGKLDDAADFLRQALALKPDFAEAHNKLGSILLTQKRSRDSIECFRQVVSLRPEHAQAWNNLGTLLQEQDRIQEAVECFHAALATEPEFTEAHNNLGMVLARLGKYTEAIACYRRALELSPEHYALYHNLGNALKSADRNEEAISCYETAVRLKPDFVDAHNHLGSLYETIGRLEDAQKCYRRALELDPRNAGVHVNQGNLFKDSGQLQEALKCYRKAIDLQPDLVMAHNNLLLALNHAVQFSAEDIYREHLAFAARFEAPLRSGWAAHLNSRIRDRRLTVGYVAPAFRHDSVARYIEQIIKTHDRKRYRLVAYRDNSVGDALTERLMEYVDEWRDFDGRSDEAAAELVREDGIDILVDLAGHSAGNRLLMFARKPAPVQVTWLGYPNTTGLSAMDYRLTDRHAEPPKHERYYTERLVYLPDSAWCYPQPVDRTVVTELPALVHGYVTFGSFNNFAKVGPEVLTLWVELIKSIPRSRILIVSALESGARETLLARFTSQGITPERVELLSRLPHNGYLSLHRRVDIALDPFPCNGGATTCDALWMGVPVITLAGDRFVSRAGASLLTAAGLAHWVARNEAEYIDLAKAWSRNLPGLARLRARLREKLRASPLMDEQRFTRNLEAAYREMWKRYCSNNDFKDGQRA